LLELLAVEASAVFRATVQRKRQQIGPMIALGGTRFLLQAIEVRQGSASLPFLDAPLCSGQSKRKRLCRTSDATR